jgi:hypothetical protein
MVKKKQQLPSPKEKKSKKIDVRSAKVRRDRSYGSYGSSYGSDYGSEEGYGNEV